MLYADDEDRFILAPMVSYFATPSAENQIHGA